MVAIVCAPKFVPIKDLMTTLFRGRIASVTSVNGVRFLQLIVKTNRRKTKNLFVNMMTPAVPEMTKSFEHLSLFSNGLQKITLTVL